VVKVVRPGGLLVYKMHTLAQAKLGGGPKNPAHLLEPGELLQLAAGLRVLQLRRRLLRHLFAVMDSGRDLGTLAEIASNSQSVKSPGYVNYPAVSL
jgi:hypothetical protein